jgi:glycosyltransferase involved in cell wall biosynthesis
MTHLVANSSCVKERISRFYGRESIVIHPPVDVHRFQVSSDADDFYLVVSRLIGYKRLHLAVEACSQLRKRLVVIGEGRIARDFNL